MFKKCQPLQQGQPSPEEVQRAVASAQDLYKASFGLGAGGPELGLALVSMAIQYQTGEFGDDVSEFERRVAELLAEANQSNSSAPV